MTATVNRQGRTAMQLSDAVATAPDSLTAIDALLCDLDTYRYEVGVLITPSLARRLINLNDDNNRLYKPRLSERYARDIANGNWRTQTGQTVKIATNGRLVDGNHRMHAIAESGVSLIFDLCFGIDPTDMVVIDAGTQNTAADVIRKSSGDELSRVIPILKRVIAWEHGHHMGPSGSFTPTPIELAERFNQSAPLFEEAARRGGDCGNHHCGTSAAAGSVYFLLAQHEEDRRAVDDFYDQLVSGLGLITGTEAVYHLRERMRGRRTERLTTAEQVALFIRAWNRHNTFRNGAREPVRKLQITREELTNSSFPQPRRAVTLAEVDPSEPGQ